MKIKCFHRFTLPTGILAGLVLLLGACSKAPEPPQQEERTYKDPEIRKEGSKTIITDADMGSGELILGATDVRPEGFPEDLPVPVECEVNSVVRARDNMIVASFFSPKKIDEARDFYLKESHFQEEGWEVEDAHEVALGYSITLRKDDRRTIVSLTVSKDPEGTRIGYVTRGK